MGFVNVINYDEFKGYIGEKRLERYKIGRDIFLIDLPETPDTAIFYKVVNDDGDKDQVQAVEVKNTRKLSFLRGKLERMLPKFSE